MNFHEHSYILGCLVAKLPYAILAASLLLKMKLFFLSFTQKVCKIAKYNVCFLYNLARWILTRAFVTVTGRMEFTEDTGVQFQVIGDNWICRSVTTSGPARCYHHSVHSWLQRTHNTLRPRQNGRHFPDDIFKWIFLDENAWMSITISLKFVPKGPINNIPTLVQVFAWRWPGDKPLSEPMMIYLLTHICVIRPQWV